MKTVIVYASMHHENTKKLAEAIAQNEGAEMINAVTQQKADLSEYDLIGFASGVSFGKYYPQILKFMENNLPSGKKVFFIHTAGSPRESHNSAALEIAKKKQCECVGTYFCKGYDTYGPFKFIGGLAKGHPNEEEIAGAVEFFGKIK